jgi:hypothetical protein
MNPSKPRFTIMFSARTRTEYFCRIPVEKIASARFETYSAERVRNPHRIRSRWKFSRGFQNKRI